MVVLFLIFWRNSMFSTVTAPIFIPINSAWGSFFSTCSPTLVIYCFIDNIHFDRCEMICHCDLIFISLSFGDIKHFSCPLGHLYVFFGKKCFFQVLCPFFKISLFILLLLSCMNPLYILDLTPYQICPLQISSPVGVFLFVCFVDNFLVWESLIFYFGFYLSCLMRYIQRNY